MRYANVVVNRSEHLTVPTTVPPWEIPVLQLIHGAENVIVDEVTTVEREYPEADFEYDRLQRRFGTFAGDGVHFVAKAYGEPPRGVQALAQEIAREKAAEAAGKIDPLS